MSLVARGRVPSACTRMGLVKLACEIFHTHHGPLCEYHGVKLLWHTRAANLERQRSNDLFAKCAARSFGAHEEFLYLCGERRRIGVKVCRCEVVRVHVLDGRDETIEAARHVCETTAIICLNLIQ